MRVIECPENFQRTMLEETPIFLAGGISNCPDWQKEFIARFKDMDDNFILMNPRRAAFDITNENMSEFQIEWEFKHLHQVEPAAIVFWFPYHTLCPITLYELGMQMGNQSPFHTKIFIGCHPSYPRFFDIKKQVSLVKPHVKVHDNFDDLVSEIKFWYSN